MKLQLLTNQAHDKRSARVKPVDHFKRCPACGCKELIAVGPDVLCGSCDWDSIAWDVQRGGMTNLAAAVREFGFPIVNPITESEAQDLALAPTKIQEEEGA